MNLTPAMIRNAAPEALARSLLGPRVAVGGDDPRAAPRATLSPETETMAPMTDIRRSAFAAGRRAARTALVSMGRPPEAIPMAQDRSPVWPEGLVGTITHSDTHCLAAVAQAEDFAGLGLDIEASDALDPDLLPEVCTLAERAWLAMQPEPLRIPLGTLIFSAKECAYKCQYAVSRTLFGFDMLDITPDPDTGQFEATFLNDVPGFRRGTHLHGRFGFGDGWVLTAMALPRDSLT